MVSDVTACEPTVGARFACAVACANEGAVVGDVSNIAGVTRAGDVTGGCEAVVADDVNIS